MGETILLSLLYCKLKKYKIRDFFMSKYILPVIIVEILNLANQVLIFNGNYTFVPFGATLKALYLMSYLFIIFKYEAYLSAIIGSAFVMLGGFCNDIAIKFNNGFMPVYPSLSYITGYIKPSTFPLVNDFHVLGDAATKVKFLTDYIDLGYSILSIGDVFIRVFVFLVIVNAIKNINKSYKLDEVNICN